MQDLLLESDFLPADRMPYGALRDWNRAIQQWPHLSQLMESSPDPILLLNEQRQILYCNRAFLTTIGLSYPDVLLGLRIGEALGCVHSEARLGGCGTGVACRYCVLANAIVDTLAWGGTMGVRQTRVKRSATESVPVAIVIDSVLLGASRLLLVRWGDPDPLPSNASLDDCPVELQELFLALTSAHQTNSGD